MSINKIFNGRTALFLLFVISIFFGVFPFLNNELSVYAEGTYIVYYYIDSSDNAVSSYADLGAGTYGFGDSVTMPSVGELTTATYGYDFVPPGEALLGWSTTRGGEQVYSNMETITFPSNNDLNLYAVFGEPAALSFSGEGTEVSPYEINTVEELYSLSNYVVDNDTTGVYFKQMVDIDMNDIVGYQYFTPIGTNEHPFKGIYDGNDKQIMNLNTPYLLLDDVDAYGLFGYAENATIKNVIIESGYIFSDVFNAGGIVGIARTTYDTKSPDFTLDSILMKIENCVNKARVVGNFVGGICGISYGALITGCENSGEVETAGSYGACGGILGMSYASRMDAYNEVLETKIYNCKNSGAISSSSYAGGIVGVDGYDGSDYLGNIWSIFDIYTTDSVVYSFEIHGCYNTGLITNHSSEIDNTVFINYVGGLLGCSFSRYNFDGVDILDSYTLQRKISHSYNTGTITGNGNLGGLVGSINIEANGNGSSHNVKNVFEFSNCYNSGSVQGEANNIGGFVGCTYSIANQQGVTEILFTDCYSIGEVRENTEALQVGIDPVTGHQELLSYSPPTMYISNNQVRSSDRSSRSLIRFTRAFIAIQTTHFVSTYIGYEVVETSTEGESTEADYGNYRLEYIDCQSIVIGIRTALARYEMASRSNYSMVYRKNQLNFNIISGHSNIEYISELEENLNEASSSTECVYPTIEYMGNNRYDVSDPINGNETICIFDDRYFTCNDDGSSISYNFDIEPSETHILQQPVITGTFDNLVNYHFNYHFNGGGVLQEDGTLVGEETYNNELKNITFYFPGSLPYNLLTIKREVGDGTYEDNIGWIW